MSAARFRKKPVVIEAIQYRAPEGAGLEGGNVEELQEWGAPVEPWGNWGETHELIVRTLEDGNDFSGGAQVRHVVSPGDWIIKGVQGEFYPCKPEIFDATYEAAE